MTGGAFSRPEYLSEALALLSAHVRAGVRPVLLCGGTDWMVDRHLAPRVAAPPDPPPIIDLTAVPELSAIRRLAFGGKSHDRGPQGPDGQVRYRLGAGVTYAALRRHRLLAHEAPILAAMARDVGAVQIQERGTLGGNLATGSPAADGVPVLMALGATIHLHSETADRTVSVDSFYTGYRKNVMAPDEMIVAVEFAATDSRWFWRKVGTRLAQAISKVALAGTARIEDGRIACARLGMASVGPTVAPLLSVRAELIGQEPKGLSMERLHQAIRADISPIDDVRSTREYRLHVAGRLVEQFVAQLAG